MLEGGAQLRGLTVAYETWGELDPTGSNAVLVCHAVTGDSHLTGRSGHGHPTAGWWEALVGPGRPLDTDRWFIVCVNVLGGCQGSTGPASEDPATGRPYGSTFPVVTIRDIVRTQAAVADHLGVDQWLGVVGGSFGGMQVLEWGVMYPERMRALVPIATTTAASAWQISFSRVGRLAVQLDPKWRGGDYYDAAPGDGPHAGLALARMIAHITYRSDAVYEARFGRDALEQLEEFALEQRFEVEGYLDYQGEKFVRRFDANSYLRLNKAMDLHDVGRNRGGTAPGPAPGHGADPQPEHLQRHPLPPPSAGGDPHRPARRRRPQLPRDRGQPPRPRRLPDRDRPRRRGAGRLPHPSREERCGDPRWLTRPNVRPHTPRPGP